MLKKHIHSCDRLPHAGITKENGRSLQTRRITCQRLSNDGFMPCIHVETNPALHNRKKTAVTYFKKYVNSSIARMSDSQPRFKNRVEIAMNFICCEFH